MVVRQVGEARDTLGVSPHEQEFFLWEWRTKATEMRLDLVLPRPGVIVASPPFVLLPLRVRADPNLQSTSMVRESPTPLELHASR